MSRLACIPNLRFDGLLVDRQRPSRKFYTDGRLGVEIEFVTGEPRQDCANKAFETYIIWGHESPLNVRFLLAGLSPRQHGHILLKFQGAVRTISQPRSPQSKRPVRVFSVCGPISVSPGRRQTDLEEEVKVAAFSHGCRVCKGKKRSR